MAKPSAAREVKPAAELTAEDGKRPTWADMDAEERGAIIDRVIPKIAASCSFDMDAGAILGRVISRLKAEGAKPSEIGDRMDAIQAAVDAHVAKRDAEAAARERNQAAREAVAIGKSLS